ncbi:MAG: hypothetical protein GWN84_05220 [Gammaproteobacteria bacterium]|nr:hypothetical protein [Gammaproteobacteria bacterium]NIR82362.1 hypothetical protein [Gammaproteobacteria bacterium]NIU03507.1 hypothetical protein [Gammaproteobacteria bacterium]NIX84781.1 hypothetical protein [Gammaproteobacteria bacterium]
MFKGISRPQTIADVIRRALSHGDAKAAAAAADALRAKGFTYRETFETVARVVPNATLAQWDALLREADEGWA